MTGNDGVEPMRLVHRDNANLASDHATTDRCLRNTRTNARQKPQPRQGRPSSTTLHRHTTQKLRRPVQTDLSRVQEIRGRHQIHVRRDLNQHC